MKPENILFTDDSYQNIKIIDFGASCESCDKGFFYVQSRYYRAPEVVIGLQYDFAVDMWSLGCIIYELITNQPLFPANDENELVEFIYVTIGRMPEKMLKSAKKYKQFFKTTSSFFSTYNHEIIRSKDTCLGPELKEASQPLSNLLYNKAGPEMIDFISKCLVVDPQARMKPEEALAHPLFANMA